jgi:hypothetical protein
MVYNWTPNCSQHRMLFFLIVLACAVWACAAWPRRVSPACDLAEAQRAVERLQAELRAAEPLRPVHGEHAETIRQLKRALEAKRAENSELYAVLRLTWSDFYDSNQNVWDVIMRACCTASDQSWFYEQVEAIMQLEDELLRRMPHLRRSIERMQLL